MEEIIKKQNRIIKDLINRKKYKEAEKEYKELLDKYPDHEGIKEGLNKLYIQIEEDKKEKKNINKKVITNLDNNIKVDFKKQNRIIKDLINRKKYKEAEKEYKGLLDKYPDHEGFKEGLSKLYTQIEGDKKIIFKFEYIDSLLNVKKYKKAEKEYKELLDKYPDHEGIKDGLSKLYIQMLGK